jgi:UDP-2-acetamido-3-amino-2,3-dideoxy-glucuronate N-acetyltransferase
VDRRTENRLALPPDAIRGRARRAAVAIGIGRVDEPGSCRHRTQVTFSTRPLTTAVAVHFFFDSRRFWAGSHAAPAVVPVIASSGKLHSVRVPRRIRRLCAQSAGAGNGVGERSEARPPHTHEPDDRLAMPVAQSVRLGTQVRIFQPDLVNLYGCTIGDETKIGAFVEIQKNASIGARCKISSHSFVCEGVTIEDEVFVGHGVMFINDRHPRATNPDGSLQTEADWSVEPTRVCRGASIGSGAVIMAGVTIGERALVGAGAVVTKDVAPSAVVAGVPARLLGGVRSVETAASK